ncbi:LPXTG cell wall anchor domain-containing protein [Staphylococcus epidermidis]|nr:LPXTG cell wall anchor domain-containing protein [Staphylococcus epidermidis]
MITQAQSQAKALPETGEKFNSYLVASISAMLLTVGSLLSSIFSIEK